MKGREETMLLLIDKYPNAYVDVFLIANKVILLHPLKPDGKQTQTLVTII